MKVFNLTARVGQFESRPITATPGMRQLCFWSHSQPEQGDVVVKPHLGGRGRLSAWIAVQPFTCAFSGSDGNRYWECVMADLFSPEFQNLRTRAIEQAIVESIR